jgi:hypothetical protein
MMMVVVVVMMLIMIPPATVEMTPYAVGEDTTCGLYEYFTWLGSF